MRIVQCKLLLMISTLLLIAPGAVRAQNVSGYSMMPNPFLFLLREPAIHDELGLSATQRNQLIKLNQSFDSELLSSRNKPQEQSQERVAKVMEETGKQVTSILSEEQQARLRQIIYRLRGISFVLMPPAADSLKLTQQQRNEIESIVEQARKKISDEQSGTFQGKEALRKTQQAVAAIRKAEQEQVLAALNDRQKQYLPAMIGRNFDASRLGRVTFKAPELPTGDEWINSPELQIRDLRGKVIALHFWTFG